MLSWGIAVLCAECVRKGLKPGTHSPGFCSSCGWAIREPINGSPRIKVAPSAMILVPHGEQIDIANRKYVSAPDLEHAIATAAIEVAKGFGRE